MAAFMQLASSSSPTSDETSLAPLPEGRSLSCKAFSLSFKTLTLLLIAFTLAWTWRLYATAMSPPSLQADFSIAACLCIMLYTGLHILVSKTTLDDTGLQQTWVWHKRVRWSELAYATTIRVRHLEWLIAPRLYTKSLYGRVTFFYAADPDMWAEFERLAAQVKMRARSAGR